MTDRQSELLIAFCCGWTTALLIVLILHFASGAPQ